MLHVEVCFNFFLQNIQSIFVVLIMQNYPYWGNGPQIYYYNQHLNMMQVNPALGAIRPQYFQYSFFDSNLVTTNAQEKIVQRDFWTHHSAQQQPQIIQTHKQFKSQSFENNFVQKVIEKESLSIANQLKQQDFGHFTYAKEPICKSQIQIQSIKKNSNVQEDISKIYSVKQKCSSPEKKKSYASKDQIQKDHNHRLSVIMEFTKELIVFLLNNESQNYEMIDSIKIEIAEQIRKTLGRSRKAVIQVLDDLIIILAAKLSKFRKTKQEMIKYIFRKIFNSKNKPKEVNQLNWRISLKMHEKNFKSFKSMNMKYVEKQFESPVFVELFQIFLKNFNHSYELENEERIDSLNQIVASALIAQDFNQLKTFRKMPWNSNIKKSIQKLFLDLQLIQKKIRYPQNVMESMVKQFKKGYAAEYVAFKDHKIVENFQVQSKHFLVVDNQE